MQVGLGFLVVVEEVWPQFEMVVRMVVVVVLTDGFLVTSTVVGYGLLRVVVIVTALRFSVTITVVGDTLVVVTVNGPEVSVTVTGLSTRVV